MMNKSKDVKKQLIYTTVCMLVMMLGIVGLLRSQRNLNEQCVWKFIRYTPSDYEKHWNDNIATLQKDVCGETKKQAAQANEWMSHASLPELSSRIFSHFQYQNNCTGQVTTKSIEPLAGLTRSPFYCIYGEGHLVLKDYLVVGSRIGTRAYLFDIGASLYNSGAGGASQEWFVNTYEAHGIKWDGIYAWEANVYAPSEVWSLIPQRLRHIYHYYNIPVNLNPENADKRENPLEYIRKVTQPEDFVLLKIDIDNNEIEEALVKEILGDERLLELIDEFYFEHHVNTAPMNRFWGTESSSKTLVDTYKIFTTMRNKGILAHGWV